MLSLQNLGSSSMSSGALREFIREAERQLEERKEVIRDNYGDSFTDIVGAELIDDLPEVPAKQLNLHSGEGKYAPACVKPEDLGEFSAVRGIMGSGRPFVAIRVEIIDKAKQTVIDKTVELIFKRYSLGGDGKRGALCENNFVTALSTLGESGKTHRSYLYSSGGMSEEQMEAVRDLLQTGETISPLNQQVILRKV